MIKNTTNKVIEFGQINAEPVVDFVVMNSKHEEMPLTRYGNSIARHLTKDGMLIAGSQQSFKIKPGKEFKRRILLNQQFDMTEGGEYIISASKIVGIGNAPTTLESNVIKIENDGFDAESPPGVLSAKELMYQHEQSQHHYDPNLMQLIWPKKVGQLILLALFCRVFYFKLYRCEISESGMLSEAIIKDFDVFENDIA